MATMLIKTSTNAST